MSIDFGTLVTHPLRIVILLVGFLAIKVQHLRHPRGAKDHKRELTPLPQQHRKPAALSARHFGTLVTHPLRIVILLVGFLAIKMLMLWLIARPLGGSAPLPIRRPAPPPSARRQRPQTRTHSPAPAAPQLLTRLEKSSSGQARDADEIDEEQPRVIVAGFGRFSSRSTRVASP
jgi:hypothetical protein